MKAASRKVSLTAIKKRGFTEGRDVIMEIQKERQVVRREREGSTP